MTYAMFFSSHRLIKVLEIMAALAIMMALLMPRIAWAFFRSAEGMLRLVAVSRTHAILLATVFPMVVRAIMLPWFPPPQPIVHDEFSYLLQADTFAHGRLANSTLPYWQHFETEYTLLRPNYASQYQPAQGLMLAAGQVVFRHPWWGVWISVGIMCGAICWALGMVIPLTWALFGAFIAALQFGIFGIWMNSYFGGAVSATAGALIFGALASLKTPKKWLSAAILCATGVILLFATRPFEGLLWSVVIVAYGGTLLTRGKFPSRSLWRLLAPFSVICLAGAGALAYYNWRVTGNALKPPYLAYQAIYGTPQPYWWQSPVVVNNFDFPEVQNNYLNQVRLYNQRYSAAAIIGAERQRLRDFWRFFIGPFLTPALVFIGMLYRDRRIRPWLWISIPFIVDKATYHAWFPAQNGPATILILLIVVQCWRHLRAWQRNRHLGIGLSRTLISAFCAAIVLGGLGRAIEPLLPAGFRHITPIWESLYPPKRLRDEVTAKLEQIPGKHLTFVRYSPDHCFCEEWVFNTADPRSQRVVYVRPYTPESDQALIENFHEFDVWVLEPDLQPYHLSRLSDSSVPALSSAIEPDNNDLFHSN
jgi:hypothetical protein